MKTILSHYISVNNDTTFNVNGKNIIIEKKGSEKRNDFYAKSISIVKDFKRQCPDIDNLYHMFNPTTEQHSIHCDRINVNDENYSKGLLELYLYNFGHSNFNTLIERYRIMLEEINGKSFFEEFSLWIKESPEGYSHIRNLRD
jgi:hypothetical protein